MTAYVFPSRPRGSAKYASASPQHEMEGESGILRDRYHSLIAGVVSTHCQESCGYAGLTTSPIPNSVTKNKTTALRQSIMMPLLFLQCVSPDNRGRSDSSAPAGCVGYRIGESLPGF